LLKEPEVLSEIQLQAQLIRIYLGSVDVEAFLRGSKNSRFDLRFGRSLFSEIPFLKPTISFL